MTGRRIAIDCGRGVYGCRNIRITCSAGFGNLPSNQLQGSLRLVLDSVAVLPPAFNASERKAAFQGRADLDLIDSAGKTLDSQISLIAGRQNAAILM
jgi:hypothetical protein